MNGYPATDFRNGGGGDWRKHRSKRRGPSAVTREGNRAVEAGAEVRVASDAGSDSGRIFRGPFFVSAWNAEIGLVEFVAIKSHSCCDS